MTDDRIDFAPLDPTAHLARFDTLVREVERRAAPELARRRLAAHGTVGQLVAWRRPLLAAAAVLLIVAATVIATSDSTGQPRTPTVGSVAEAVGVPVVLAQWVPGERTPSVAELLTMFGGRTP